MFQTASKDYFFFRFPPLKIASYNPLIDAPPTQPPMGSLQGSRQSFRRQSQEPLSLPHRPRQYKVRARRWQRYLEYRLKTDGRDLPRRLSLFMFLKDYLLNIVSWHKSLFAPEIIRNFCF